MQNFTAITSPELRWGQNEISIKFKLWWKNCLWNGPHLCSTLLSARMSAISCFTGMCYNEFLLYKTFTLGDGCNQRDKRLSFKQVSFHKMYLTSCHVILPGRIWDWFNIKKAILPVKEIPYWKLKESTTSWCGRSIPAMNGDKTILDESLQCLESFYPPRVTAIDQPQLRCCGFFVSFIDKKHIST